MKTVETFTVRVIGHHLPGIECAGYRGVHVALQVGKDPVCPVPGDAERAVFTALIRLCRAEGEPPDFAGPAVHGRKGVRFLYLTWGEVSRDGAFTMFRRAKLHLTDIPETDLLQAATTGATVEAEVSLTGADGTPLCASVHPPRVRWQLAAPAPQSSS
ncbi:DUF5990 family protein [Streptomyces sp. NBC_01537]|uniref:DUF5990 family protein n=1 Tax=Streptomyces sp. NBC_01537 TaxID=2903896 RepID=UPI00386D39DF